MHEIGAAFVVDVRLHLRMMRVYGCSRNIDRRISLASELNLIPPLRARPRWDRGSFPPYRCLLDPANRSAGDNFYSNWAIQCF